MMRSTRNVWARHCWHSHRIARTLSRAEDVLPLGAAERWTVERLLMVPVTPVAHASGGLIDQTTDFALDLAC
jgi:hypothetical protein